MSIFLSNVVIAFLLVEVIVVIFMGISLFYVLKILKFWNFDSTNSLQYDLEKKNYLINTILFFTIYSKIVLFVFFVLSLNELALIVPGAMCSAGVIGANAYGNFLLLLKILLIFCFGIWLILNFLDLKEMNFPFLKRKYIFFIFIFFGVVFEFVLEILYFSNIPLNVPVFCCSVTFQAPNLPFGYTQKFLVLLFYIVLGVILILNSLKQEMASFICNLIFLFVSYYAVTYFFGIYVYEAPNHKCPYCLLLKDYYYIGYFIWGSLFLGIFYGISPFLITQITKKSSKNLFKYSSIFLIIHALICSFYVVKYYIKVGVFL